MGHRLIVLAHWLIFAASVCFLFWAAPMVVLAFYHPNSVLGHYIQYAVLAALGFSVMWLVLATRHTLSRGRREPRRMLGETTSVCGAFALACFIGWLKVPSVPAYWTQHLGQQAYRIPSAYTELARDLPAGKESGIRIDFCPENWAGIYQQHPADCEVVTAVLYPPGISIFSKSFDASYLVDDLLKAPRRGDRLTSPDELPFARSEGPGWLGFSGRLPSRPYGYYLVLSDRGDLTRFGSCYAPRPGGSCKFVAQTAMGLLVYEIENTGSFDVDYWTAYESRILELIAGWRAP